jgi:hypothetical protein
VTGFVLSMVAAALLLFLLGPVSLVCAVLGIVYSRRGSRKVERGETRKHAGLAKAGYIAGIVTTVLGALVTAAEIALLVAILTDDDLRRDFEKEFEEDDGGESPISGPLRLAAPLMRLALDRLA